MIIFSFGRRELGKTTLAYYLSQRQPTCLIFDPRGMFATSPAVVLDGAEVYDLLDMQREIIVQPQFNVPQVFESVCEQLVEWATDNPQEPFAFLIDEARFVDTPSYVSPYLDWLLRFTPRDKVHIYFTAHRPSDISVDIRAIGDYWLLFHTTQEHDLKVITERCGPVVAAEVNRLADYEVIVWNDARAIWHKITDRRAWFVPIKKRQEAVA